MEALSKHAIATAAASINLRVRGGTPANAHVCPAAAPALRTPLSIAGSYASPFAMMGHHEMNGSLTSPSVYPGLISPQMSAAAAAAYGRSPIVSSPHG